MAETAEKFIEALNKLESERDLETIVSLFAENCKVGNVVASEDFKGAEGAREFWQNYRQTFGEVKSEFHNRIISDGAAALEWTTTGTSSDGAEIEYDGVSILETEGDKITRFYAYFDPHRLGDQIKKEGQASGG